MHADFPAYQILHPLGQFTSQHISQRPRSSTHWNNQYVHRPSTVRKSPSTGGILPRTGWPTSINPPPAGGKHPMRIKKGSRSRSSTGTPNERMRRRATLPHPLECSTIAVPGLSFRVRKGTGRLTWAMTTAKPIQDGQPEKPAAGRTETSHDSGRGGPGTGQRTQANQTPYQYRHCDHKKQRSLPSNEKTTTGRDPIPKGDRKECAAFAR